MFFGARRRERSHEPVTPDLAGKAVAEEPSLARAMNSLAGSSAAPDSKPAAEAENRGSSPAEAASTQKSEGPSAPQLRAVEVQFAIAFTRVISVLMKSNPYRTMPLNQVEGLVVPMIMTGQFAIMDAEVNGQLTPVAVAFWALVSPEVDQRLSDPSIAVPKLAPDEWRSGEITWLLDVVGHPDAAKQLIGQLNAGPFAGRDVKVRRKAGNRHPSVSLLRNAAGEHSIKDGDTGNLPQHV